ncbi:oligopeptidase A [Luminiphilus syltensis NOR5-1B]|uniref:oligopeptidase A n=1 Tax=Luminiphilus syltensis NOR5-1B TaxID=565045 RepID=B8KRE7_9GAMM|nr:M3 family metallopeptidase [Luminiphilus syltensis]EED35817.1 oligopeptidase A [Luminiphilus syltensis NOR5-1B]
MKNPLLETTALPAFTQILPEHVEPAIDQLLAHNRAERDRLLAQVGPATWEAIVEPLAVMENQLSRAWGVVSHLNSVMNSDELRVAHTACLAKLSNYYTEMGQNRELFEAYSAVMENAQDLSHEQRKVLENALLDFRLSGVDLEGPAKEEYRSLSEKLSGLSSAFSNNVLDASNAWTRLIIDREALAGLPESALAVAAQSARQREMEGYLLTLDAPSFLPVMTYAEDAALREEVYQAFSTRASDQGPQASQFDNTDALGEILAARHRQADLLGFGNYAELSLAKKMARSTGEVMDFLQALVDRVLPQAKQEFDELCRFTEEHFGVVELRAWDVAFFSEKLRQHKHQLTEEEVKVYFPADRVISGMFEVVGRLFSVHFHPVENAQTYHPDVLLYEIRDRNGEVRAQFYFDLYARQNKRGGAWMAQCQSRMKIGGVDQIPVAYMTCNFTPGVDGEPSLLTHREVETLFHEFGHGLHHMLTRVDHPDIAGISGVAWDAVELPSQFMENYCWQREALDCFAAHHETGAPLPDHLYQRMIDAKNFQAGMAMVRQLEFSLFDFKLHLEFDPESGASVYDTLNEVRDQVSVLKPPEWNRFAHAFTHVFGGGYAAGYYSYKWAEVLSADAFSLFEERGIFDPETGAAFLSKILERGGADDAMNLFVDFRGREPEIGALLRHSGIAA